MTRSILTTLSLLITGTVFGQESIDDYASVLADYGNLRTIAGLGEEEEEGHNYWQASFEGANALAVELSNPHMTMADAAGNYYIADKESHSILKVDASGIVTTWAGTHEQGFNGEIGRATEIMLNNPNGLYVFPDGTLFILDFFNRRVRRVDQAGNLTTVFEAGGFGPGRALWVSPDEDLIYVNGTNSVQRWTPSTGFEVAVTALPDPGNLTVDPDGNLVVTSRANHLVYRVHGPDDLEIIAGNGTDVEVPLGGVPATEVGLEWVRGVTFLGNGAFFVAAQKGGDVWYVDTQGIIHPFVRGRRSGNEHSGEGQRVSVPGDKISEPRAVTVAPNGNVIITTNDKGFVRIVERFQDPIVYLQRSDEGLSVVSTLVAGRPYHLEQSPDLKDWQRIHSYDESTDQLDQGLAPDSSGLFFRVTW